MQSLARSNDCDPYAGSPSSRDGLQRGDALRELPGRNLVRASCGWWTNEDDLQRLLAGVAAAT